MTAEWTARLDKRGAKVLCGRLVNGRAVCRGVIAERVQLDVPMAAIPYGYRPSDDDPSLFVPTNRSAIRLASGRAPMTRRGLARNVTGRWARTMNAPDLPFRRACPECGCIALVTSDVLVSEGDNLSK